MMKNAYNSGSQQYIPFAENEIIARPYSINGVRYLKDFTVVLIAPSS
jgi:hypothetical protein